MDLFLTGQDFGKLSGLKWKGEEQRVKWDRGAHSNVNNCIHT